MGMALSTFVQIMLCTFGRLRLMGHTVAVHMKHYGSWVDEASLEAAVERYNEGLVAAITKARLWHAAMDTRGAPLPLQPAVVDSRRTCRFSQHL